MANANPNPIFSKEIDLQPLRKQKLFISTPMYGGACVGKFALALNDLCVQLVKLGIPYQLHHLFNESLIPRARNYCVDAFLRSDATHMLFIDADIGFEAMDVVVLMSFQNDESEYDIIGAPYAKKNISWEKVKYAVDQGLADEDPYVLEKFIGDYVFNPKLEDGKATFSIGAPVEVLEIGTGFMMIRRKTFEQFIKAYPNCMYRPDHVRSADFDGRREIAMVFQADIDDVDYRNEYAAIINNIVGMSNASTEDITSYAKRAMADVATRSATKSRRYLSEDYWFCQKSRDIGLKTWLCPWMKLSHTGSYIYEGSFIDLLAIGASPTADPSALRRTKKS